MCASKAAGKTRGGRGVTPRNDEQRSIRPGWRRDRHLYGSNFVH
jgi:hypothetical protein